RPHPREGWPLGGDPRGRAPGPRPTEVVSHVLRVCGGVPLETQARDPRLAVAGAKEPEVCVGVGKHEVRHAGELTAPSQRAVRMPSLKKFALTNWGRSAQRQKSLGGRRGLLALGVLIVSLA